MKPRHLLDLPMASSEVSGFVLAALSREGEFAVNIGVAFGAHCG